MSPELRLLLAGVLLGCVTLLAVEVLAALWWLDRQAELAADVELRGVRR